MRLLLLCLFAGLSVGALPVSHADALPPHVQLNLSQQIDHACDGIPDPEDGSIPGDCILYRIEVINTGQDIAYQVNVKSRIPEHTILKRPLERLDGQEEVVDTLIEQNGGGVRFIKTLLRELPPGEEHRVVLEYAVQIL